MKWIKTGGILANISLGAAILHTHASGSLFPAIPISLTITAIAFLLVAFHFQTTPCGALIGLAFIISVAVATRWYITYYPASLIGFDPDLFASWVTDILLSGSTETVSQSFYSDAPLFLILAATTSFVIGVNAATGLSVYTIVSGVAIPLFAALFGRKLTHRFSNQVMLTAAVLGAVMVTSFRLSYWPIAQLLGVVYLTIFYYAFAYGKGWNWRLIVIVFLIAMVFTHKLSLLLAALFTIAAFMLWLARSRLFDILRRYPSVADTTIGPGVIAVSGVLVAFWLIVTAIFSTVLFQLIGVVIGLLVITAFWNSPPKIRPVDQTGLDSNGLYLLPFIVFFPLVQWVIVTDYIKTFIIRFGTPFVNQGVDITLSQTDYVAARLADPGVFDLFFHHHSIIILTLVGGLVLVWRFLYGPSDASAPLAAISVIFLILPFSLTVASSVGIGAPRAIVNIEVLLAALIAVGLIAIPSNRQLRRGAVGVLIILIVFQTFSASVVPDYPGTYRAYLTQEEVDGKVFAHEHIQDEIDTDYYYSRESILPVTSLTEDEAGASFNAINDGYLNATLFDRPPNYVAQRTSIDVYRFNVSGNWELEWDPESELNQRYSRVYSNDGMSIYTNPQDDTR